MRGQFAALAAVLVAAAPAANAVSSVGGSEQARDPARLTYSLSIRLTSPLDPEHPWVQGGSCLAGASGSEGIRITPPGSNGRPTWSPDGRRIAYARVDALIVRAESGRTRRIADTAGTASLGEPAWSPDGEWIAYAHGRWGSVVSLLRPDGSARRTLPHAGSDGQFDTSPAWSPDGQSIAVAESGWTPRGYGSAVYIMGRDGANSRKLVDDAVAPSWSADGQEIVFVRRSSRTLFVVRADGTGERQLTGTPGTSPAWSPDGEWIAFEREGDIALIRPDGTGLRVARTNAFAPAWRPAAPKPSGALRPCVMRGTEGNDVIHGTPYGDLILSGRGADTVYAGGRDDVVDSEGGADLVFGGSGRDLLSAGSGNDRVYAGGDDDDVNGGPGNDRVKGGNGDDLLAAFDGERDVVVGGAGLDVAWADNSLDTLSSVELDCPPGERWC